MIDLAQHGDRETYNVLEISSFQLETIQTFHPHIAVILNITPDHLDRHGSFQKYVESKARIFENQSLGDYTILNADDSPAAGLAARSRGTIAWFSRKNKVDFGGCIHDQHIVFVRDKKELPIVALKDVPLKGAHNVENVLAAICVGMLAGCVPENIRRAVAEFKAVEHRLEWVAMVNGVTYYNDSKATNVDATVKALESFPANIHLILGGKDKDSDYTLLLPLIRERVRYVYTMGTAAQKIESQLAGSSKIISSKTLENAVKKAAELARANDVVLLAPACASFDQFDNYEHRGRVYKQLVHALERELAPIEGV